MKKSRFYLNSAIILGVLSATLLSACSSSNQSLPQEAEYNSLHSTLYSSSIGATNETYAETDYEFSEATEVPLTSESSVAPFVTERKLIRNAYLSVETIDFDNLISEINQTVTELGGYTEQSDISGNSLSASTANRRNAYLIVRIPSQKLNQFINQIEGQGNITSKSESTQDVTLQYFDIESRKKSLTIEQERLWDLLEKADTLEAIIALESRLSEIRYQLESFESQLRLYDNQVEYSTITLNLQEVQIFTPTAPDSVLIRIQKGFSRNLAGVSAGLINFFVWFVSSLPTLALLAVIIGGIIFVLSKIIKKHSVKKASKIVSPTANIPADKISIVESKKE